MRLCHSSILIFICLTCLGADPSQVTAASDPAQKILELAQSPTPEAVEQLILRPGNRGAQVQTLQTQLKELGHYEGVADGQYGITTQIAVSKFQQAQGLVADGIAGITTRQSLQEALQAKIKANSATPTSAEATPQKPNQFLQQSWISWGLIGLGGLGGVGALLNVIKLFTKRKKYPKRIVTNTEYSEQDEFDETKKPLLELEQKPEEPLNGNGTIAAVIDKQDNITQSPALILPPEKTTRLAKVNIIEELIKDLNSPDPTKRRKAIWDLGQQGDSRAIQPLFDLMMEADSHQRSLILAALSEIGTRTLKPMNRALAISLQDESPEVRQNAIRDLARVYEQMAQMSQMLVHALQDDNPEVQETAKYALSQMNRIRALSSKSDREEDDED